MGYLFKYELLGNTKAQYTTIHTHTHVMKVGKRNACKISACL